ncbi:hypothetical protein ACTXT7_016586 [Hymenolepis weldensis]
MLQVYCILILIASSLVDISFAQYDGKSKFNASYICFMLNLSSRDYKVNVSDGLTITWDTNALKNRGVNNVTCLAVETLSEYSLPKTIKSTAENAKCSMTSIFSDTSYNVSVLENEKRDHLSFLRSRAVSGNKIKLSWDFRSFSKFVYKPMNLSCKKVGDSAPVFTETLGNATTNFTVDNLEEDTDYLCTINTTIYVPDYDQSAVCRQSYNFDSIKTKYAMRTPSFRSVQMLNDTSVEIEFEEPAEVDGDFRGFEISMKNSIESDWTTVIQLGPKQRTYVVPELNKGSTYYFRVRGAVLSEGYSNYSEYSSPIELPAGN